MKWNKLNADEKRLWFENSYRMHQYMDVEKRQHIYEQIEKARKKSKHRKPKNRWWRK